MKSWFAAVPSRLARPILPSSRLAQKTCVELIATPQGVAPLGRAMKLGSSPVPSRFARPIESLSWFAKNRCVGLTAMPHGLPAPGSSGMGRKSYTGLVPSVCARPILPSGDELPQYT